LDSVVRSDIIVIVIIRWPLSRYFWTLFGKKTLCPELIVIITPPIKTWIAMSLLAELQKSEKGGEHVSLKP
jgi:hypothetical protein